MTCAEETHDHAAYWKANHQTRDWLNREEVTDMSAQAEELVIVDMWTVPSDRHQQMADALRAAHEQLRRADGFIEGDVLANDDDTKVAAFVRFRSAEDWQRATELEEFREQMGALEAIGSSHAETYARISVIAPPTDRGPIEVTHGQF